MKIGLVGCTKSKLDHAVPARELYMPSPMFRGRRAYVERSCDRWLILSAKHGVVDPYEVLEPYDETLVGKPTAIKRAWAQRILSELQQTLGDLRGVEFEIHAGADYWNFGLRQGLEAAGARIEIPTKGMAQGQQLAFYKRVAATVSKDVLKPESLNP